MLTGTISLSMKVNLGNYESAEIFLSVQGIDAETTEADLNELLDGNMKLSYNALKARFPEKLKQLKEKVDLAGR